MLSIPLLFFALLEVGLRLGGYGETHALFITHERTGPRYYQNPNVARRYFSRHAVVPASPVDFFEVDKRPDAFRVFVQGGSTAAGFPYYHGGAFPRILSERLSRSLPDRKVEVVNTAMAAVNTYTLLDLSREILAQQPDAILIYAGHNEYYGALGVGSSESLGRSRWLTGTYVRLKDIRTVQLLRNAVAGLYAARGETPAGAASDGTLMKRMVGNQSIPYGSELYRSGANQFRANLRALLDRYRDAGVPVFIATLSSNERDHRPFLSQNQAGIDLEAWRHAFDAGRAAAARGAWSDAVSHFDRAIAIDTLHAETFFLRGTAFAAVENFPAALSDFVAAKDRDLLRFRAPEHFNEIIREEAARAGATVVEVQNRFRAASENGMVGNELMLEHLHPNTNGYQLLADAFYDALRDNAQRLGLSSFSTVDRRRSDFLLTALDSLTGDFRLRLLMGSWPFQPPGTVDRSLDTLRPRDFVERLALGRQRREISWLDGNRELGTYLESRGEYDEAVRVALAIRQQYPFTAAPYLAAGRILLKAGRNDEALPYFQQSNAIEESADASKMAGTLLLNRGDTEIAIRYLERSVALAPRDEQALYNLSGAYALTGQFDRARDTLQRLLHVAPGHDMGRRLLLSLPA